MVGWPIVTQSRQPAVLGHGSYPHITSKLEQVVIINGCVYIMSSKLERTMVIMVASRAESHTLVIEHL